MFAIQVPSDKIYEILNNPLRMAETGELYAIGPDYQLRNSSRFEGGFLTLDPIDRLDQVGAALSGGQDFFPETTGINGHTVVAKSVQVDVLRHSWVLVGEFDVGEIMKPMVAVRNQMAVVAGIASVISIFLGWLTANTVTKPLARLGSGMQTVSAQNFDHEIEDTERGDEIGELANTLVAFRDKLLVAEQTEQAQRALQTEQQRVVERLSTAQTKLADGDLTSKITTTFHADYDQLRQDHN
ncbi:HAMP domain-containing protein [Yoonia sp. SDW83-1]|uniref:HAMP domain-containing protein n=1 Tax=Yoonia sp. SDW83-1 TaxID=3366945 RepID=UPI00398C4FBF